MISAVLLTMSLTTCLQSQVAAPPSATTAAPAYTPAAPPTNNPSATPSAPAAASPANNPSATPAPAPAPSATTTSPRSTPYAAFPSAPGATPGIATPLESPTSPGPATADSAPYVVFKTPPGTVFPSFTPPPRPPGRFVFAVLPGLTFGINARMIPSTNVSLFFGGRLRGGKWALGYQLTGSSGLAERYWIGLMTHRHHITALTNFGRRGFATIGAGVAIFVLWPAVAELETRIGVRFGARKRGVVGGQIRLGHNFYYHEKAPLPQFGLFVGFSGL